MGRHGYWFPLMFLGFGVLGLLVWDNLLPPEDFGSFADAPAPNVGAQTAVAVLTVDPSSMRDPAWTWLIVTTLVATTAWYGRRARQAGDSVRPYVVPAIAGGLAVPIAHAAAAPVDSVSAAASLITSVGLPLIALGGLAGAFAYSRPGPWRRPSALISLACLVIGVSIVLGPGLLDPVTIALGLLALAWFERSRLLAAVAIAVPIAMVAVPAGNLIPAALLLLGGILALLRLKMEHVSESD